jgi:hypothetical protein
LKFLNELAARNDRNFKFTALVRRIRDTVALRCHEATENPV